ncbi:XRE family transcriptional regulator [Paenibacillus sp. NPDC058177]|uniref:XRE family transcriptional regulator n=1 Tax=Paenibacillus sp. NPDC058177 TaxID=3346369 RepID=UPI0036DA853D
MMKETRYSLILKESIKGKKVSLSKLTALIKEHGVNTNKAYISKLQNGKLPPAGDKLNNALATALEIDPAKLKAAAYIEKIPTDVLKELVSTQSEIFSEV